MFLWGRAARATFSGLPNAHRMIFGGCPYCDGPVSTPCADVYLAFSKEVCPACGKTYWLKHSRWEPEAMTLDDFTTAGYTCEEATKSVRWFSPSCRVLSVDRIDDK